jgi:hypothetical protein
MTAHDDSSARTLLSGAIAGTATSFGFAALHHLLISNIWFSVLPMLVAGAISGLCLAWSYSSAFTTRSIAGWLKYNMLFVALFLVLGGISFVLYEPIYTIQGLIAGVEPMGELLRQALPLSAAYGIVAGLGISMIVGANVRQATSLVVTSLVLTVLLGHNVAILGMVHMSQEAVPLLAQFYGLVAAIMFGNAATFVLLERRRFFRRPPAAVAPTANALSGRSDDATLNPA